MVIRYPSSKNVVHSVVIRYLIQQEIVLYILGRM